MLGKLEQALQEYWDENLRLNNYVHDLAIESQNSLVGELFETVVVMRNPLNPNWKAINFKEKT